MAQYFADLNYLAIVVSGIAFFLIGFVWYSLLFGKVWAAEHAKHGVKFDEKPSSWSMAQKMIVSFICNTLVALALAVIIRYLNLTTIRGAFNLALLAGVGISGAIMLINYNWEGKTFKLFLIDWAHQFVGIFVCSVILVNWRIAS